MRKIHDDYRLKASRLRKELEDLKDSVKDLELESQRPHMEDNQYTRRIRTLENKLDKAMIKYNEAQSIRKTYEQIVRRLREERVGFDNQLAAIERTLAAKQRDYEELMLLSGDANHAKEVALGELDRVRTGYEEERKRREREIRERNQVVLLRRQMIERAKHRDKLRAQLEQDGAESRAASNVSNSATQKLLAHERIEARNKIDIFENAFRRIKEATGVSDVNEVIQKIVSQEGTTENLIALTKENQMKIENMNEIKRKLKARVEEIKYSGVGGGHRRKMVDDHEDQLANSAARLERSRLKYERLSRTLISMKAGIGHLQDKLEGVREEVGVGVGPAGSTPSGGTGKNEELSDESVGEVLRSSELILVNIMKRIKAAKDAVERERMLDVSLSPSVSSYSPGKTGGDGKDSFRPDSADFDNEESIAVSSRPYNQRISLTLDDMNDLGHGSGLGGGNYIADIGDIPELDEEELTRDKVKRASRQITDAIDRKKRRPKKRSDRDRTMQGDRRLGASAGPLT